ncbi:MAG: Two component regulator propeller [Methanoregula sp. PtaU1.Bin051]|nr:MAG: Two component regulator propeller [Methanoregula sp. PtaU1.Bin051]
MVRAGISDIVCVVLALCCISVPALASTANMTVSSADRQASPSPVIRLFIPASGFIHSDQINDAINGKSGDVLFATAFGLSDYNGSWSTRHVNRVNLSEGLLDDFITAIEYDPAGNLWIGYSGGIQIFNGATYQTIRDQQLLKDTRIKAFQRWGETMWVATGSTAIHRVSNGSWTWFQPFSKGGPGFYDIDSMALDPRNDSLIIATENNGIWMIPSQADPVTFLRIDVDTNVLPLRNHVRQDPMGGVYFFNESAVTRYTPARDWVPVLTVSDLTQKQVEINDIAAGTDGTLYIGTDDGIFFWRDGVVAGYLGRFEGIGTSTIVRWLFMDAKGRLWFATQGSVGYYEQETAAPVVTIMILNQTTTAQVTATPTTTPPPVTSIATPVPTEEIKPEKKASSLFEILTNFISDLISRFRK